MEIIKITRAMVTASQQEFAQFLGISRSMLAMVETGRKPLAIDKLKMVMALHDAIRYAGVPEEEEPLNVEMWERELLNHRSALERAEQRMASMKVKHSQSMKTLRGCERLLEALPSELVNVLVFLKKWRNDAERYVAAHNRERRKKQELNIARHEFAIAWIQELLEKAKP